MQCRVHYINPLLRPFISGIWSSENNDDSPDSSTARVLPNTLMELTVHFSNTIKISFPDKSIITQPRLSIVTQMQRFLDMELLGKSGFISVFFSASGAFNFFNMPVKEVADQVVALSSIHQKKADELEEQIALTTTLEDRVHILQQYLLDRFKQREDRDKTIEFCEEQINSAKGQISIEKLSDSSGISNRQLLRRFNNYIGISPKELARKVRFMNSVFALKNHPLLSLTEVAYETGYYDQAHFIHDFSEYSGLTPGEYLARADTIF